MSKICPACGLVTEDQAAFCRACGGDLRAMEGSAGPPAGAVPPIGPFPPPLPGPLLSSPPAPGPPPPVQPAPQTPEFPPPPASGYLSAPGGVPGYDFANLPPSIPTRLVWAILSTILCCLPLGIVSIVYAAQVNTYLFRGDIPGAQRSSRLARNWAIASIAVSVVGWIICGVGVAVGGLGALGWLRS